MARIQNLDQFVDYVKLMLGGMVNAVEMSDEVIIQIIENSTLEIFRYLYEEATYLDYVAVTLSAGVDSIPTSALRDMHGNIVDNVHDVYNFQVSFGLDGINTMFSPTNILLYDAYTNKGNYPGNYGQSVDGGMLTMANYEIAMGYLKLINNTFSKMYTINYRPQAEILEIIPTPKQNLLGILTLYRRESVESLYNHVLMQKLVVGRCMKQWGLILGKYNVTLPDSSTINYQMYLEEGKAMEQDAMERIQSEGAVCDFFIA